jgi:hypothetical protein
MSAAPLAEAAHSRSAAVAAADDLPAKVLCAVVAGERDDAFARANFAGKVDRGSDIQACFSGRAGTGAGCDAPTS